MITHKDIMRDINLAKETNHQIFNAIFDKPELTAQEKNSLKIQQVEAELERKAELEKERREHDWFKHSGCQDWDMPSGY